MDLEDLLSGKKRGKHGYRRNHDDHDDRNHGYDKYRNKHDSDSDDYYPRRSHRGILGHSDLGRLLGVAKKLPHLKALIAVAVVGLLLLLVLGIVLLALLFPVLKGATDQLTQTGIKGILESALSFLNSLWQGRG